MNSDTLVDAIPPGYRWATPEERQRSRHPAYYSRMVMVKVTTKVAVLCIKEG